MRLAAIGTAISLLGMGLVAKGVTAPGPAVASPPPNIVLILTDDQRWDAIDRMPHLQSDLIDHGVRFTNMVVDNPLCCPSRASILTGQRSHLTGVWNDGSPYGGFTAFKDGSTIATWLHAAGYQTALIGKYLNGYESHPAYVPPGWDRWDALTYHTYKMTDYKVSENGVQRYYGTTTADYKTDVLANYADSFIRSAPSDKPLFLYFTPNAPHWPSQPASKYATAKLNLPYFDPPSYNEADMSDKPAYMQALPLLAQKSLKNNPRAFRLRQYRALLSVDDAIAKIMAALRDTGRLSNTLIAFSSDNGYEWGEHRWEGATGGGKIVPYIESLRVPLVIRYDPLTTAAGTDSHLVSNIDLAPTFAQLAGVSAPGAEGSSLVPFLAGQDQPWRTDTLIEHERSTGGSTYDQSVPTYCGLHSDAYTYVVYATGERELYDEKADPYELNNVVNDPAYQSVVDDLHARLMQECQPAPPGLTLSPLPTPTPTDTASPSPTDTASPTPTDTASPSPTDTASPTPTP